MKSNRVKHNSKYNLEKNWKISLADEVRLLNPKVDNTWMKPDDETAPQPKQTNVQYRK